MHNVTINEKQNELCRINNYHDREKKYKNNSILLTYYLTYD